MQENFILLRKKPGKYRDKNKIGIIQNWWNTADIDDPNDWKKPKNYLKYLIKNLI